MAANEDTRKRSTPSAFGRLVKRLRNTADLTQEELAERAGVSARLISDLERGMIQRPRRDTVQMLANGLGLNGTERDTFVAITRRRAGSADPAAVAEPPAPPINLPLAPVGLVGRQREVSAITSLLMQPEVRLLTLTGTGGVGKTSLAIDAAARVAGGFSNGAAFVDLAPVTDPALIGPTLARTLGMRFQAEESLIEQLIARLRDMHLIVVLDNVERLVSVGPELAQLLARCPGLTIVATSRQPLRLRAEREYPVSPLTLPNLRDLPELNELSRIPAIDLFIRRAQAVRPSIALNTKNARIIAELVVRLDGLPLAIELAAPRLRVLTPTELLARLDRRLPILVTGALDLPERHKSLRATIDWSYELLSHEEQQVFRRLAIFNGGFTLAAAEHVGAPFEPDSGAEDRGAPPLSVDVMETLTSLVSQNLLRALEPSNDSSGYEMSRFSMLETIREYGLERLTSSGEEADARGRHAAWCVALAEQAGPELTGPNQAQWFTRLEVEHDNLRAALRWTLEQQDADTALRLCGALARFWYTAGFYGEARRWMEQVFALAGTTPSAARAKALLGAGVIAQFLGDYERAEAYPEQALADYQVLGDKTGIASAYGNLGVVADAQQDYELAAQRYEQALALFRELGDDIHIGFMLGNLGLIAYLQGNYDRAMELLEESLALSRAREDRNSMAIALGNLGLVAFALQDYERAEMLQREALELRRALSNRSNLARVFENFALISAAKGEPRRSTRLFGAAAALRAEIGAALQPNDRAYNERFINDVRSQLGDHAFSTAWQAGTLMSLDEAIDCALRVDQ
jgi:predicted ATPase/transcriptional regulator with XRE-family HTH domain